ncbi:MAG: hypothetical protein JXA35_00460, partial [Deltaproteobacteria bacterium]|nr:hypothetical protein [Deltaproteobacteria bacterium]
MYNFEENQSSSEYRTENIINEYAAPIPGSGLFFNNETRRVSHWSVPWSDLMMTMFVLFAVLYVYHAARKDVQATPGKSRVYFQEEIKPVQAEDVSRADTETLRIEDIR